MYLKLPPPLVLLVTLGGMYLLSVYWPLWVFSFTGQYALVWILGLIGSLPGLAGIVAFARARTTVNPHKPHKASRLVTSGIYRFSRNPMYLGLLVWLIAAFVYLSAISAVIMIPLFILYMNNFQIEPEEDVLEAMFGDEYREYCRKVRRWC